MCIKENYIRVTELLKPWQNFGDAPQWRIDEKGVIGTNVHESIHNHSIGLPTIKLTDREEKYFDSYKKWEETTQPVFLMSEQRLYDEPLMLTGQVDCMISFPSDKQRILVDFKTSAKAMEAHWAIQIGWYYLLAKKNGYNPSTKAFMLQLKDTGGPAKAYPFEITDKLIGLCYSAYNLYVHFNPIKNMII